MQLFGRHTMNILLLGDVIVFLVSLVATLGLRYRAIPSREIIDAHLTPFLILFVIWMGVFLIAGLYDRSIELARKQMPMRIIRVQFINMLLAALFFFALPFGIEPKTNLVIYLAVSALGIGLWRMYIFPHIAVQASTRMLIVGNSTETFSIVRVLLLNQYFKSIEVKHVHASLAEEKGSWRDALFSVVTEQPFDIVVADLRDPDVTPLMRDLHMLVFAGRGTRFLNLHTLYEQLTHRVPSSLITEEWFLQNMSNHTGKSMYDILKRCTDIALALVVTTLTIPFFPFIALAVKLQDGGTVFYVSERVGQYNKPFRMYKFRTMSGNDAANTINSTLVVTRLGRFLRATRLDELPQLLNVFRGDLSFIGPRPETPARAAVYAEQIPYYMMRHHVRPGLSGWAQISNFDVPRTSIDVTQTIEKLSFDLYYLKNRSLILDIEVALKTIGTIISRTGT